MEPGDEATTGWDGHWALIIPAFNAGRTLGAVLAGMPVEATRIVVVDDGSRDNTALVAAADPRVVLLQHQVNQGKGMALRTAFDWVLRQRLEFCITMDADGQHAPEELAAFLGAYVPGQARLYLGSRWRTRRRRWLSPPLVRTFSNRCSSALISWVAGCRIEDAQCGFRLYPTALLEQITPRETRYALETEILLQAVRHGYQVVNVPIACRYPDGTRSSHYRALGDSWRIALTMVRFLRGREAARDDSPEPGNN